MSKNLCKPTILAILKCAKRHSCDIFTAKWGSYTYKTQYICKNCFTKKFDVFICRKRIIGQREFIWKSVQQFTTSPIIYVYI